MTKEQLGDLVEAIRESAGSQNPFCNATPDMVRTHTENLSSISTTLKAVERRLEKIDLQIEGLQASINKADGARQFLVWVVGVVAAVIGAIGGTIAKKL